MTSEAEATGAGTLRAVELAVDAWCSDLDPAVLTGPHAAEAATRVAGMIRKLTASQLRLAGRVDETRAFTATHRDAAGWLAATAGSSVGDANRMLRTGERLAGCPTTREAFEAGALSLAEAEVVSQAATADPSAEGELVELATRRHNLHGLRERADRVRRGAHRAEDEAARAAAIRASRRWIETNDPIDGAPRIDAKFVPRDYAAAKQVLARFQQRIYDDARRAGRRDSPAAYAADAALAAILAGGSAVGIESPPLSTAPDLPTISSISSTSSASSPAPAPAALFGDGAAGDGSESAGDGMPSLPGGSGRASRRPCVVVDAIALQRGWAASGETCEIPGVGPVDVAWARRLMGADVFDVVVHDGVDITAFATTTRHIPRALEVALAVRDPECTDPDCTRRDHLEIDHLVDFEPGHDTSYGNLRASCGTDHDDKTQGRIQVERRGDEWWFTSMGDPGGTGAPPQPRTAPVGEHLSRWNLDHLPDELPDERAG